MSVSGKILYNKVQGLRPELSNSITLDVLDKICQNRTALPFLEWFCENVNCVNVLSDEEVRIKNNLQEANEWLEGSELDRALEEAAADCPDLLKTVSFNDTDTNNLFTEYDILKELNEEDKNYIKTLQNGIQNLKQLETKLDEDVETEEELLHKENIAVDKTYKECYEISKEFDVNGQEFFKEVECLLNIYADAPENKGKQLLWTQMPLELFIKKIELYNHYLGVHIKRQFGDLSKEEEKSDSSYDSLINNEEIRIDNEKLQKLSLCKIILHNAKMEEILAKVQEKSHAAMFNYIQDIYNSGNLKVPRHSELRIEISGQTKMRDFLEENVSLLQEHSLTETVQQFSDLKINKVLKQDALARLKRTKHHLEKLKNLQFLARKNGHVRTDLLRMLMEMQFSHLRNVSEFVADAYHYLITEYSLSSARCESMQYQQNEYSALLSSPKVHNSFHKHFISMISNGDDKLQLNSALDKYNDIIGANKTKKQFLLKTYLDSTIHKLETMEDEISSQYLKEIQTGPTHKFKPVSYEIETYHNEAVDNLQKTQTNLTNIRNQMKKLLKTNTGFEKEKKILWQRFLVDPETLKKTHTETKQMVDKAIFSGTKKALNE